MSNFGFGPGDFLNAARGKSGQELITLDALRESARTFISPHEIIPVGSTDLSQMNEALEIAELWLNDVTLFPSTNSSNDVAWSRREWLDNSLAGWQKMVEPLAEGMATALSTSNRDDTTTWWV